MELNAAKWKETVRQGNVRPAFFGDVVTQDNIGSPINKAAANYDDHSNALFVDWLGRRCAASSCQPALLAVFQNKSFNIREHIAQVRAKYFRILENRSTVNTSHHVAMEKCGTVQEPSEQDVQIASEGTAGQIRFTNGLCLTSKGATPTRPGECLAEACSAGHNSNQIWTYKDGEVRSARTDCAGGAPCCLVPSPHNMPSEHTSVQNF
jgi:hypothetical protein